MHKMMAVLEFPPRLVLSILVKGEFLNGMWSYLPSACMAMTWVKKKRLLLMCWPSFWRWLVAPMPPLLFELERWVEPYGLGLRMVAPTVTEVLLDVSWMFALSEPARSMKLRIAWVLIIALPSADSAELSSSSIPSFSCLGIDYTERR